MSFTPPPPFTPAVAAPVVSGWASKINWTQVVSISSMLLTASTSGKLNISPDQQAMLIAAIGTAFSLGTMVMRTYFITSIIKSSAAKLPPVH